MRATLALLGTALLMFIIGYGISLDVENLRYAMNHARVGYQLARTWHLSEDVCLAILHHHDIVERRLLRPQLHPRREPAHKARTHGPA